MRDVERLDRFYDELKRIHKLYFPDWREFQLFYNMFADMKEDPFYWETDQAINYIQEYANKYGSKLARRLDDKCIK